MDGLLLINKPKNMTSRDVVNKIGHILNTKKIGHTGTLDPIATGVLVLCIGKYTKLFDLITSYEKEYIATAILGIETDTLDITGNIINKKDFIVDINTINKVISSFKGEYMQEVPAYSAIKVNGKKLYEYARNNEKVELPKRRVNIKNIELINYNDETKELKFKVLVSKGTYIRSLIRDIGNKLDIPMTMKELERTKQGKFDIENCFNIEDIKNNNFNFLNIEDVLDYKIINIDNNLLLNKIKNGALIENIYDEKYIMFKHENKIISIYKIYEKNEKYIKPYKMLD